MVIGMVTLVVVLASTELFESVGLIAVFVGEDVFIIDEAIVVAGMIAINNLFPTTTLTIAIKPASKHNVY